MKLTITELERANLLFLEEVSPGTTVVLATTGPLDGKALGHVFNHLGKMLTRQLEREEGIPDGSIVPPSEQGAPVPAKKSAPAPLPTGKRAVVPPGAFREGTPPLRAKEVLPLASEAKPRTKRPVPPEEPKPHLKVKDPRDAIARLGEPSAPKYTAAGAPCAAHNIPRDADGACPRCGFP